MNVLTKEDEEVAGTKLRIVKRREWGAKIPRSINRRSQPASAIFYGNTWSKPCAGVDDCKMRIRDIQERNINKYKLSDIRYNFLLDEEANVYVCRGWLSTPSLPERYRTFTGLALYICFIGFFTEFPPTIEMLQARQTLLETGMREGHIAMKHLEFHL